MCQPSNRSREMYEFPSSAPKSTLFLPYTLRPRPQTSSTARQHLNGQNVLKVGKTTIPFLICGANDLHRLQQRRPSQCRGHRPAEALGKTRFETIFWNAKKKRRTQSQECSDTIWKAYKKQKRWNIWPYSRVSSFLGGDTSNFMSFCRIQNSLPSTESLQPSFQFNLHAFGSFSGCTAIRVGTPKPRLYSSKHIPMFSCMVFRWFQCTVASLETHKLRNLGPLAPQFLGIWVPPWPLWGPSNIQGRDFPSQFLNRWKPTQS